MATRTARARQAAVTTTQPHAASGGARVTPAKKPYGGSTSKSKGKPNASILSFFKKAGPQDVVVNGHSGGLFFEDSVSRVGQNGYDGSPGVQEVLVEDLYEDDDSLRFNEKEEPVKRRRLSNSLNGDVDYAKENGVDPVREGKLPGGLTPPTADGVNGTSSTATVDVEAEPANAPHVLPRKNGPFVETSDSEGEDAPGSVMSPPMLDQNTADYHAQDVKQHDALIDVKQNDTVLSVRPQDEDEKACDTGPPLLKRESTSYPEENEFADLEGMQDFEGMDDLENDEYADGEEAMERRWIEEQDRLEMAEGAAEGDAELGGRSANRDSSIARCPMCNISFAGISDQDASVHVNHCLDGDAIPLPECKVEAFAAEKTEENSDEPKFRRPIRPARPGQENPFTLDGSAANGGSAFSTLMSNHAEDRAWAAAAAAEHAARGKPAYQRTCPFYKILPGFFIVVDGFRYGAVKGTQAYFLSHFHSDHYIGLTASWCHGPIYCSRVTANLVRQQLRVDPKWVIGLDFEKKVEVSGTNGVHVTMIPANHCPGSSLYLFEKVVGRGKQPKVQRILHCGDFRACPAHLEHPLLRPDVLDAITGKGQQQKLDVCYLDTTYLNPKYAFPSQQEVITACADMCVSLNKIRIDDADGWEEMKRQRAGSGMVKFVRKSSDTGEVKDETEQDNSVDVMVGPKRVKKERGKLLVVVGTYSIGKERICLGIARALDSKIYAPPSKQRICACLEDSELNARLTNNPREAQVHMTPLFEIRAETLDEYLRDYSDVFSRVVGFRPTGWNYRPPNSRFTESPAVQTVLYSENWKSSYNMRDLVPQRGSTKTASCFGVPYSEHSSFRELTMFCCALRIEKIIPTVNVGSAKGRERMKAWCDRWAVERKKNGLFKLGVGKAVW